MKHHLLVVRVQSLVYNPYYHLQFVFPGCSLSVYQLHSWKLHRGSTWRVILSEWLSTSSTLATPLLIITDITLLTSPTLTKFLARLYFFLYSFVKAFFLPCFISLDFDFLWLELWPFFGFSRFFSISVAIFQHCSSFPAIQFSIWSWWNLRPEIRRFFLRIDSTTTAFSLTHDFRTQKDASSVLALENFRIVTVTQSLQSLRNDLGVSVKILRWNPLAFRILLMR